MDLGFARQFPFASRFLVPAALGLFGRKSNDHLIPLELPKSDVIAEARPVRVRRAFADIPATRLEATALRALMDNPGSTCVQLSKLCGWVSPAWQTHLILLCHRRRHVFWPSGLDPDATNATVIGAIADYDSDTLRFWIKEDVAEFFRATLKDIRSTRKI